jgi:hypothetical protein
MGIWAWGRDKWRSLSMPSPLSCRAANSLDVYPCPIAALAYRSACPSPCLLIQVLMCINAARALSALPDLDLDQIRRRQVAHRY